MKYHFEVRLSFESKLSKFWTETIVLSLNLRFLRNSVRFPYQKKSYFSQGRYVLFISHQWFISIPSRNVSKSERFVEVFRGYRNKKWRERVNNDSLEDKKCHRSTCSQVFFKISVLKNFATFKGQHLRWESIFKNVAGVQLYEKKTSAHVFSYEYCQIFKNTYFTEHLRWLVLVPQTEP